MRKFIVVFLILITSCGTETASDLSRYESAENANKSINPVGKDSVETKKPVIIYDTLVFAKSPDKEFLAEKFKSSQTQLKFYKKFIKQKSVNQLKIINGRHTKTEIKYLGKIKDLNGVDSYDVVTNFHIWGIGQMLSPRGRSEMAFVNKDQIIIYKVSMPYDLPERIEENIIYFRQDQTKIGISISGGLPAVFCVPQIGCN